MLHPRIYPWLDLNQQPLPSKGNASCQLGYRGKLKSEWQGSNLRHSASKAGALPTALHPDILLVGVEPTRELFLRELPLPIGLQELILDTPGETRTHTWTIFEIVASSDWATGVYYTALPGLEPRILEPKSRVLPITPQGNKEREGFEPSLDFISNQPPLQNPKKGQAGLEPAMQYKLRFYRPLPTPIGADPKLSKIIEKMGCQGIEPWLFRLKAGCITILPTTQMYCPDRN